MVQIVNRSPNFGDAITKSAGEIAGIYIAKQKEAKDRVKVASALEQMGIPKETASGIAGLPKHLQEPAFKNYQEEGNLEGFKQMLGLGKKTPSQMPSNALQNMIGRLFPQQQQQVGPFGGMQQPEQGQGAFGLPSQQPEQGQGPYGMQTPPNFMQQMMGQGQQQELEQQQEGAVFDPANMTPQQRMAAYALTPKRFQPAMLNELNTASREKAADVSAERAAKRAEETGIRAEDRAEQAGLRAEKRAEQAAKVAEEKAKAAEQTAIKRDIRNDEMKFDETLSKERETNSKIINEAKAMKKIAEENKKKFGSLRGYTSLDKLKRFERDEKLREFDRRQASLITKLASAQQGASRMTDMARKLIVEGKIDRTQPYETILSGLNSVIEEAKLPENEARAKDRLKKKFDGKLPQDFRTQISDILSSETDPLSYPQWFKEDTVFEDDNGQRHIVKNGQWTDL